jgi:hypothetical protein
MAPYERRPLSLHKGITFCFVSVYFDALMRVSICGRNASSAGRIGVAGRTGLRTHAHFSRWRPMLADVSPDAPQARRLTRKSAMSNPRKPSSRPITGLNDPRSTGAPKPPLRDILALKGTKAT